MLTGDNTQTAQAVAEKVGIKNYRAEVMPSDKADFIKELQQNGKVVAMVGDGINDSQALAQADVSIAMGKGSDIAMDVAKMTIISSDLQLISKAIRLSKLTVGSIHQNLFLGIYLQPDRDSHSRRPSLPHLGIYAEPDDRRGGHGHEFGFGGKQQSAF